jgi:hypothetical protein
MQTGSIILEQVLNNIEGNGGKIIKGFRSLDDLANKMREVLATGHAVAFAPTTKGLRHFYNTAGFITTLSLLTAKLGEVEVLVPPGLYGQQHVFAVGPKRADGQEYSASAPRTL